MNVGKENINQTDDTYKISTVWLGNDFHKLDTIEDSDNPIDQPNDLSIDEVILIGATKPIQSKPYSSLSLKGLIVFGLISEYNLLYR